MATIFAVVFGITTIVCGVGWFLAKASLNAALMYFIKKEYTLPTDEELEDCSNAAIRQMLGLKP